MVVATLRYMVTIRKCYLPYPTLIACIRLPVFDMLIGMTKRKPDKQKHVYRTTVCMNEEMRDKLEREAELMQRALPGTVITLGDVIRSNIIKGMKAGDES